MKFIKFVHASDDSLMVYIPAKEIVMIIVRDGRTFIKTKNGSQHETADSAEELIKRLEKGQ